MNETRTINLNGLVYHIDYDAYQLLRDYIQDIELRLPQDDRKEVIADIEARIAELFQNALFAKNVQVVNIEMVNSVKAQIGEPSEFGPNRRPQVRVNKSQNSGCGRIFSIVLNVVLAILALPMIFAGLIILLAIIFSLFGVAFAGTTNLGAIVPFFHACAEVFVKGGAVLIPLLMVALVAIVVLPIVMLVHTIVTKLRTQRGPKPRFWWITILFWFASVIFWGSSLVRLYQSYDRAPQIFKSMSLEGVTVDEEGTITSPLQLDAYHSIQLNGAASLTLSQAEQPSTVLTTNIHMACYDTTGLDIQAEVRDSILYIRVPDDDKYLIANFSIALPELRKITVYGASEIETADDQILILPSLSLDLNGAAKADLHLSVETLNIDAKGASQLELEGTANNATIAIAGAGELEADDFIVNNLHINCAGAGRAEVNVSSELWAQAAGASKITYKGTPRMIHKMAIGSSIIKQDK